jgi:hypothetical protein
MSPFQQFRLTMIVVLGLVIALMIFDLWWHMWYKHYKRSKRWERKRINRRR